MGSIPEDDKLIQRINKKSQQLRENGLTRADQELLKNSHRLQFIWNEAANGTDSEDSSATAWRKSIPPTECSKKGFSKTMEYLDCLEDYEPYRLDLNHVAKRFFESTATAESFADKQRFLDFMDALFPGTTNNLPLNPLVDDTRETGSSSDCGMIDDEASALLADEVVSAPLAEDAAVTRPPKRRHPATDTAYYEDVSAPLADEAANAPPTDETTSALLADDAAVMRPLKRKHAATDAVFFEDTDCIPGLDHSNTHLPRRKLPDYSDSFYARWVLHRDAPEVDGEDTRDKPAPAQAISIASPEKIPPVEMPETFVASLANAANPVSSELPTERPWIYIKASLPAIAEIFDPYTSRAVMKLRVQNDNVASFKGAVTMVFPLDGLVDCLMSLEIYLSEVEYLAMALFKTRVKSEGLTRYVCLREGGTLTPNPEITLSGVVDQAIIDVFGPRMHRAIATCRVRETELGEGILATRCVSMILTNKSSDGCIINLSLGLEQGIQIRQKLYT